MKIAIKNLITTMSKCLLSTLPSLKSYIDVRLKNDTTYLPTIILRHPPNCFPSQPIRAAFIMDGDGGPLNNSRAIDVCVRAVLRIHSPRDAGTSRVSVKHSAVSKTPLHPLHVIVERAGNLFNKDALWHYALSRRARKGPATLEGKLSGKFGPSSANWRA